MKKIFPENAEEAARLLGEQCGQNLPGCKDETPESLRRIRFAALKVSGGNIEKLWEAVSLAKIDWRDLLMWAGFESDVNEHEKWASQTLR
ncbi:MAG: hypothetical protein HZB19_00305 [Chloroflexi bacterium]|nr:hypothetical protein [Chloroflexota bacterium]